MNREFDNGFDEEEERLRGRSRKRDLGAGAGADSDTMPGGRAGSSRRGINGGGERYVRYMSPPLGEVFHEPSGVARYEHLASVF